MMTPVSHGHLLRLSWGLFLGLALVLLVAGLVAQSKLGFRQLPEPPAITSVPILANILPDEPNFFPIVLAVSYAQAAVYVTLGLLLFRRKSGDVMGVIASCLLIGIGLGFTPTIVYLPLLSPAWHIPATIFQAGLFVMAFLFLCLFPDGRFFPAWSRYAVLAWSGYTLLWLFVPQLNPHRTTSVWSVLAFATVINLGIVFQIFRYRRLSDPAEKRAVKWVLIGFSLATSAMVAIVLLSADGANSVGLAAVLILSLAPLLIPVTIGLAIQRQNLWDIGSLARKSLVYGILTVLLAGAYYFSVVVLQNLLTINTNRREPVVIILTTLLIAALFQPVRDRVQRGVNRLLFGDRDDPYVVLSALSQQLREAADPGSILPAVTATITQSLKLPYAAIELTDSTGERHIVADDGRPSDETESWPLRYHGEIVGRLLVEPRSPGETFTPRERLLLQDIATQAGAAAYSVRLLAALQGSRERLVLAREEERRRIRRDLHDELGPALASQTFKLDTALERLESDPAAAAELLQSLKTRNQELVGDIRRLVYELRPPALDELGLLGALRANTSQIHPLAVTILACPDPLPPLPAAVEVAAYRIAIEAINNVVRHAHAESCAVNIEMIGNHLSLTITDDGRGIPADTRNGIGLRSIRERVEELGGKLTIENQLDSGLQINALLPL